MQDLRVLQWVTEKEASSGNRAFINKLYATCARSLTLIIALNWGKYFFYFKHEQRKIENAAKNGKNETEIHHFEGCSINTGNLTLTPNVCVENNSRLKKQRPYR